MNDGMRILLIDIETAPNTVYTWGLFKQNINLNQVISTSRTLCWAAKWLGEEEVEFRAEWSGGHRAMVRRAYRLLSEADAVIHFNGTKFDIPILNKEFVKLGLTPPEPFKQIDLLKTVRSNFRFSSNKLDHVLSELGLGTKVSHPGFQMWVDCMNGDPAAQAHMEKYNRRDVTAMEPLYRHLLPWIASHPNHALYRRTDGIMCPKCASVNVQKRGLRRTAVQVYQQIQCKDCGGWSSLRTNMTTNRQDVLAQVK